MNDLDIEKSIITDFTENHLMSWIRHKKDEVGKLKPYYKTRYIKMEHYIKKSGQMYYLVWKVPPKTVNLKEFDSLLFVEVLSENGTKKYYLPITPHTTENSLFEWVHNPSHKKMYYSRHTMQRLMERGKFGEGDIWSALLDHISSEPAKAKIYSDPENNKIVLASKSGIFLGQWIQDIVACETYVSCDLLKNTQDQSHGKLQEFFETMNEAIIEFWKKNKSDPVIRMSDLGKFRLDILEAKQIYAKFYEEK